MKFALADITTRAAATFVTPRLSIEGALCASLLTTFLGEILYKEAQRATNLSAKIKAD